MVRPTLFFSDGVGIDAEQFFFGAGMHEHRDSDSSLIGCFLSGEWGYHSVPEDFMTSITYVAERREVIALGKNGLVKRAVPRNNRLDVDSLAGRFRAEQLKGADTAGPLERIRAVGTAVFACGWGGQLYRCRRDSWEQFDLGSKAKSQNFTAVDGFAEDDVYAVGMKGIVWHFDGNDWRPVESPTNRHLYDVRCFNSGDLVTCGAQGGLFKGRRGQLKFIGDPSFDENFWAVEEFRGKLYATMSGDRLAVIQRGILKELSIHPLEKRTTYRLSATPDALYSFGPFDIAVFDGKAWKDIVCPENT